MQVGLRSARSLKGFHCLLHLEFDHLTKTKAGVRMDRSLLRSFIRCPKPRMPRTLSVIKSKIFERYTYVSIDRMIELLHNSVYAIKFEIYLDNEKYIIIMKRQSIDDFYEA